MAELFDELSVACSMCGRLHIDCDSCPCIAPLGLWVIDGCHHCMSRDGQAGARQVPHLHHHAQ